MTLTTNDQAQEHIQGNRWLKRYYSARAAFSIVWVCAAAGLAGSKTAAAPLLLIYPAWDAIANLVDAQRNGGLRRNPSQAVNAGVSLVTTIAVGVALTQSMNAVLGVFGVWAALSGILQLATGARRRRSHGAQWPMVVSGIQSALAGGMFLVQANAPDAPQVTAIAPYVAFGAFYFLISAVWLSVSEARRRRT